MDRLSLIYLNFGLFFCFAFCLRFLFSFSVLSFSLFYFHFKYVLISLIFFISIVVFYSRSSLWMFSIRNVKILFCKRRFRINCFYLDNETNVEYWNLLVRSLFLISIRLIEIWFTWTIHLNLFDDALSYCFFCNWESFISMIVRSAR